MYQSEFNCTIQDKKSRSIKLELDEDNLKLFAYHDSVLVGEMHFNQIEYERDTDIKLIWMYLDMAGAEYMRAGIGRHMLILMNEFNRGPLIAEKDGGPQRDDGSHLTGDASGFVRTMREEGLIQNWGVLDEDG